MKKGFIFIFVIVFALIFLTNTHLHYSFGDLVFRWFGVSSWTKENQNGVHLPVILGLIILASGIIGTVRYYSPRYPKVRSRIFLGCIAFAILYPLATEKTMFLFMYNTEGIRSIHILEKDSRCSIQTTGNEMKANCSITLFNYGNEEQVNIRPVLSNTSADIQFEKMTISITPHTKAGIGAVFNGVQGNGADFQEPMSRFKFEVEVNENDEMRE